MQIDIVNNTTSDVAAPGERTVAAGATGSFTGRSVAELIFYQTLHAGDPLLQVHGTLEDADYEPLVCTMKDPGDAGGGATTLAACGFDIATQEATATDRGQMYMGVFDDAACTTLAANATLDTAATGTIDAGAGTNLLTVTPATGELSVTLTDAVDETVYMKAWPVAAGRAIDTSSVDDATFSA